MDDTETGQEFVAARFPFDTAESTREGFDVDLFVIGGGSGGLRAAKVAAGHGARVILAEESRLGGTCVIRGCVPKKLFVYASRFGTSFDEAAEFGWRVHLTQFDWPTLVAAKDREIARLEELYEHSQEVAGVQVVKARATLEDAHTVRLSDGRRVRARVILIASGSRPELPPFEGIDLGITSDEAFDLKSLPKRIVIGGAGYISVEFAGIFAALGSDVTIVCRGDNVLRGFDQDIRLGIAASYTDRGIKLIFGESIVRLQRRFKAAGAGDGEIEVTTDQGARLIADQVLLAFGRVPNTSGLALEAAGVKTNDIGSIVVDADSRTSVPSIYAIGDVSNRVNLTPVAIREGHAFADSVFGNKSSRVDYNNVPTAVFTSPEIGCVGLTEDEARSRFPAVDVYKSRFRTLKSAVTGDCQPAMLKVLVDHETDRVLGFHLFAENASEMVQMLAIAIVNATKMNDLLSTMAVHPTFAEELVTLRSPVVRYDRR